MERDLPSAQKWALSLRALVACEQSQFQVSEGELTV
jgi:hypothetical protein